MSTNTRIRSNNRFWIIAGLIAFLIIMTVYLYIQGRLWFSASGDVLLWVGDAFSSENSQQLMDPYSFSHFLHGVIFFFVLKYAFGNFSLESRFAASVMMEGCWEMLENSAIIINRYRDATAALGYNGDTIYNSYGDLLSCSIGFIVARYIGLKWSIFLFIAIELICLFWIKDNLTLNVIMLIYPIDGIKEWQLG
ncbi:MAG: DUF2585 family protein [Crocinitomicaceae bacterium]